MKEMEFELSSGLLHTEPPKARERLALLDRGPFDSVYLLCKTGAGSGAPPVTEPAQVIGQQSSPGGLGEGQEFTDSEGIRQPFHQG